MHQSHTTPQARTWVNGLALLAALALPGAPSLAQNPAAPTTAAPLTRADAKAERDAFLKTHRWDEQSEEWKLKSGVEPPFGVMSRAEVKAARDDFLSKNTWNDIKGNWEPIKPAPRVMSTLTRSQVRKETVQFMKTHSWNEEKEVWVMKPRAAGKP